MDSTIVISLIGLGGVVLGSLTTPLVASLLERKELKRLRTEKELLEERQRTLTKAHDDLLQAEALKRTSRRLTSLQLAFLSAGLGFWRSRVTNSHQTGIARVARVPDASWGVVAFHRVERSERRLPSGQDRSTR